MLCLLLAEAHRRLNLVRVEFLLVRLTLAPPQLLKRGVMTDLNLQTADLEVVEVVLFGKNDTMTLDNFLVPGPDLSNYRPLYPCCGLPRVEGSRALAGTESPLVEVNSLMLVIPPVVFFNSAFSA